MARKVFWLPGERPNAILNAVLKFANGGVKRHRQCALPADQIGPFELDAEAMSFLGYFERIRGERDDIVVSVDLQSTFQGFIEWRHIDCCDYALGANIRSIAVKWRRA